jgi:hypothetical protein
LLNKLTHAIFVGSNCMFPTIFMLTPNGFSPPAGAALLCAERIGEPKEEKEMPEREFEVRWVMRAGREEERAGSNAERTASLPSQRRVLGL